MQRYKRPTWKQNVENCVDSLFVQNFDCVIFAFRANLDWLTLQAIKLVRVGDYYQVTNLWLLLYYREFRRLKITVLHLFGKKCDRTSHKVHPNSRVRLDGDSRHRTFVTAKAIFPSHAALWLTEAHNCPWAGGIALFTPWFLMELKSCCVVMGLAAPGGPMPATQSRGRSLSVHEAQVQRALWLLRGCWAGCELEFCFSLLPSLQVQACLLRCRWGWSSPQGSAWPRALFRSSHWPSACISILLPDTIPFPKFFLKIPQDHHKVQILPALSQQQKAVSICVQTQTGLFKPLGFPGGASGKEPGYQCRTNGMWVRSLGGEGWTWRRAWQPTPVFLPGESHGQRSLAGYSPQGHKESNMTEVT